ncbi:hypothetical protein B9N43_01390 [Denitratisoma sp. DHT3]|uniref:bifunctional diguanylate cyclase/phosphodiesterase n=1 Tax=Denitratisoma sp. DHT3 TaxID=1981880 RepID=UPI001198861A|nr:GGDEF domain-containing phosphodiesterase [Denitratisoma sp. DHT3]QDX80023.1 hypothetical protein B9N43_01390 [Denitratisoma sp. DHT3]
MTHDASMGGIFRSREPTVLSRSERSLTQTLMELQAILENATVGIMFTRNRMVSQANSLCARMWGYEPDEFLGLPGIALHPSEEAYAELGRETVPVLISGRAYQTERQMMRKDGSLFWCRISAKAVDPQRPREGTIWIMEDITEDRLIQEALDHSARELMGIFETSLMGIAVFRDGRIARCNSCFETLFGVPQGRVIGGLVSDMVSLAGEDMAYVRTRIRADLESRGEYRGELKLRRLDGSEFWAYCAAAALDSNEPDKGVIWLVNDVTPQKEAEEKLYRALVEQEAIFNNAGMGILLVRGGVILRGNRRLSDMFGYTQEEMVGQPVDMLYRKESRTMEIKLVAFETISRGENFIMETEAVRKGGDSIWVRATGCRAETGHDALEAVWLFEDITERHLAEQALIQARDELEYRVQERTAELARTNVQLQEEISERVQTEQRIWHLAHHDALTGLPNRVLLHDRLGQVLAQADRKSQRAALLFLDLDRFKSINDSLGHSVGDELLKQVAERLRRTVRAVDTVSRMGGDEFVVVLDDVGSVDDVVLVAEKIIAAVEPPIVINGQELRATPSIGISIYPEDGNDAMQLMKNADTAMYHAKAAGRNNFQFFTASMNEQATRFFNLETRLRAAFEAGDLLLYYQPLVDLRKRSVVGMEALMRWRDPAHGMVSPMEFIPVAEETGLILPLGEWVLHEAMRQNRIWQEQGHPLLSISVNLSPRQFRQRGLVDTVRAILAETGQPARLLELEITESTLMQDVAETMAKLEELAAMGVRLSIDDFGTGYSSLSYLKRFPVHKLKVDQSFTRDLCEDKEDAAIVMAIIGLAHNLDLDILAEGVETERQLSMLMSYGCHKFQGYYFSRPQAPENADGLFYPPSLLDLATDWAVF